MSDNSNNPEFGPIGKEEQIEEIIDKPENPSQPAMSENQDSCPEYTSGSDSTIEEEEEERENENILDQGINISEEDQTGDEAKIISANKSEKQIAEDDDQDGFKTPTSSEHRIPAITECPPAPRKPLPSKWKRRGSPPPAARRCLRFDALEEVDSIFRPAPDIDDDGEEPKSKKARRDDDDDNEDRS